MRKSRGPEGRFTDGPAIDKHLRTFTDREVVSARQFHEEIMGMLSVSDSQTVGCLSSLKQQRIITAGDRHRFEAQHGSQRHALASELAAQGWHQPIGGKKLVASS